MNIQYIAVLVVLACGVLPVQAQGTVSFGLKVGLASSELRSDRGFGGQTMLGFNGGVFGALPVRGSFSALAQVDYYRKGYRAGELRDETNTQLGTDADFQYDYIAFLVAPRYKDTLGSSGMDFYAFAGPRLDLLVVDRVVATVNGERDTIELAPIFLGDFHSVVFGVAAGIGLDLVSAISMPLLVELRYDADVTPAQSTDLGEWHFRTFSFRVGYSF